MLEKSLGGSTISWISDSIDDEGLFVRDLDAEDLELFAREYYSLD